MSSLAVTPASSTRPLIMIADVNARLPQPLQGSRRRGRDSIECIPLDRWEMDRVSESNLGGRFGGFVDSWADFDAAAFGINPSEAALMDPQQRLLLAVCPCVTLAPFC